MNTPVSFEIAKLLKEKGFSQLNQGLYYTKDKEHCLVGWGYKDHTENSFAQYSAPNIAEVVMWLYERHGIWTVVNVNIMGSWYFEHFDLKEKRNAQFKPIDTHYDSPTEAYEAAIEYTLKNLI